MKLMNDSTRYLLAGMLIGASALLPAGAGAGETPVAEGCEKELKDFAPR